MRHFGVFFGDFCISCQNTSAILFQLVEDLMQDIMALDDFKMDILDETMSDALIDIISSIHIWFVFNLGANSQYGDLTDITKLTQLITRAALSNSTSIINEKTIILCSLYVLYF